MTRTSPREITRLLRLAGNGDEAALHQLLPLVYEELHALAEVSMNRENRGHTLQPTALVHEAYLRLVDQRDADWVDRTHFFAVAATSIRRILVDHARRRLAERRGGRMSRVPLEGAERAVAESPEDVLAIDDAMKKLAEHDPRKCRVVELRIFSGLGIEETASVLDVSHATVERDWSFARAWLARELRSNDDP